MFSILICTRNSNRVISEVISSIFSQTKISLIDEVILVDYMSKDDTIEIVNLLFLNSILSLKIINCTKAGKSNALVEGLNISKSSYTIILDDDNILMNDYIENAYNILNNNKNIGCLGSMGFIDDNFDKYPSWFDKYKASFAIGLPAQNKSTDWVWGAASIIKMDSWIELTKRNFNFCLNVERLNQNTPVSLGGEDVELSLAIKLAGYDISFSDKIKFIHKFDTSRLVDYFLIKNNEGVAVSVPIHEIYRAFIYHNSLKNIFFIWHLRVIKKIIIVIILLFKEIFFFKGNVAIQMQLSTLKGILIGYKSAFNNHKTLFKKIRMLNNK